MSEFVVNASSISDFIDLTEEEVIRRIHKGFSLPKEMVPTRPQSTADSSRSTPTTAAESQDQTTTVKTPPYIPDSNNGEQKVGYCFSF